MALGLYGAAFRPKPLSAQVKTPAKPVKPAVTTSAGNRQGQPFTQKPTPPKVSAPPPKPRPSTSKPSAAVSVRPSSVSPIPMIKATQPAPMYRPTPQASPSFQPLPSPGIPTLGPARPGQGMAHEIPQFAAPASAFRPKALPSSAANAAAPSHALFNDRSALSPATMPTSAPSRRPGSAAARPFAPAAPRLPARATTTTPYVPSMVSAAQMPAMAPQSTMVPNSGATTAPAPMLAPNAIPLLTSKGAPSSAAPGKAMAASKPVNPAEPEAPKSSKAKWVIGALAVALLLGSM